MCGIVGFYSENFFQEDIEIACEVIRQSKIRGLHSFGFTDGKICHKDFDLENLIKKIKELKLKNFIFHNRYSTSGDYKDHNNNQPIEHSGNYLVFNGVISQATKEENEINYNLKLKTENDGEILLHQKDIKCFLGDLKGSFAGLMFLNGKMFHYRNERRPSYFTKTKNGSTVIASTSDIMKRAGVKTEIKKTEINTLIEIK